MILEGIGEDPERGGLKDTPNRVARMFREIAGGVGEDPTGIVTVVEGADFDEMIMVRDIPLYSICEHHLIPFNGRAHVAYVPNKAGQITGLSKIARVVDVLARKPQVQERLTTEIADTIERALEPRGVFVVIEAEHLCMTMRGIKKPGSVTVSEPGFFTPRIVMHRCSASITTKTPRGSSVWSITSAIWVVSRSCT